MATYTGAQLASWRTTAGLTVVDAAPILRMSRRAYIGLENVTGNIPDAQAAAVDYYIANASAAPDVLTS